jgi:O-methyltransferase
LRGEGGGPTAVFRLKAYGVTDRNVWVVDSFAGLPPIDREKETFAWDAGDMAVSLDTVQDNFCCYGLLDEQVKFLKGFFSDTLPTAPIGKLAILRVDADLYQSTMDVLNLLYKNLSVGGYAIFDDYQNLPDCQRAIEEFRSRSGITEPVVKIDKRAVYWRRER